MNIISIEPTPSPNTMKINLDTSLPANERFTYYPHEPNNAPEQIRQLLTIPGVHSVFHAANFLAISRISKSDWPAILGQTRNILGDAEMIAELHASPVASTSNYGEVTVKLQVFRSIPLHVRVSNGHEEVRLAMPEQFTTAGLQIGMSSPHFMQERKLIELGTRYGELHEIAHEIIAEQVAIWSDTQLQLVLTMHSGERTYMKDKHSIHEQSMSRLDDLQHADWQIRYAALQQIKPSIESLPLLLQAQQDKHMSIRRLATVYLGDIKLPEVLPYLIRGLQDMSPAVRRTAGDTLSDFGDPAALPAMCLALHDDNQLVRWRAARFLYEYGDESCVTALQEASLDPEFEVRMQVQIALERIQAGLSAEGSVWQQMTRLHVDRS